MLTIRGDLIIDRDDYAIYHMSNGLDELTFELSLNDSEIYPILQEGKTVIQETKENQRYLVRKINAAGTYAVITCRLNLPDWECDLLIDPSNLNRAGFSHTLNEVTMLSRIMQVAGLAEWTVVSKVQTHQTRTMEMEGPTPLEAAVQLQKTFGCALRFDTANKRVTVLYPQEMPLSNSFVVDSVNLRSCPQYKGRSTELYTRIYPVGKDGLGIASVNNGIPYLDDHSYTKTVICKLWVDARYTDAASMKRDAKARLSAASRPIRSWTLDVIDLIRINPAIWPEMELTIWTRLLLQDSARDTTEPVQVVGDVVYPYYPERNKITVSTEIETLQNTVAQALTNLQDPNGALWAQIKARRGEL